MELSGSKNILCSQNTQLNPSCDNMICLGQWSPHTSWSGQNFRHRWITLAAKRDRRRPQRDYGSKRHNIKTSKLKVKSRSNHYQYKNEPVLTGCGGYHITSLIA